MWIFRELKESGHLPYILIGAVLGFVGSGMPAYLTLKLFDCLRNYIFQ